MREFFYFQNYGPSATTEMIICQISQEKEEFFSTRYLELGNNLKWFVCSAFLTYAKLFSDPKIRSPPEMPDTTWKLESLKL